VRSVIPLVLVLLAACGFLRFTSDANGAVDYHTLYVYTIGAAR